MSQEKEPSIYHRKKAHDALLALGIDPNRMIRGDSMGCWPNEAISHEEYSARYINSTGEEPSQEKEATSADTPTEEIPAADSVQTEEL